MTTKFTKYNAGGLLRYLADKLEDGELWGFGLEIAQSDGLWEDFDGGIVELIQLLSDEERVLPDEASTFRIKNPAMGASGSSVGTTAAPQAGKVDPSPCGREPRKAWYDREAARIIGEGASKGLGTPVNELACTCKEEVL